MTLACKGPFGTLYGKVTGPMDAQGAELRINCGAGLRPVATCDLRGTSGRRLRGFQLRRTDGATGAVTTSNLPYQPLLASHTATAGDPPPTSEFSCSVGREIVNQ